ncbi:M64 family metallopeptidase [uncultured Prevotella sp.]|uniref:M64 family metallopeptidase n=1 Tax=uncultured Prevotella sp. TaxID=159272 RepID=UPI00261D2386|nr:M64 family metallopeptidase [uncultured Prevotella sp.]
MKRFKIHILVIISIILSYTQNSTCQTFDEYFIDRTLRIDYIFSGDAQNQKISLDKLNTIPGWYGKKQKLAQVPVEGNGQITVRAHKSNNVIYKHSFSTLFQEWLSYDEAKTTSRSFENVFLIPMPKDTVDITIDLYNNRREKSTSFTHIVNPNDILIRHIGEHDRTPYRVIQQAEDTTKCIHIAFVAEGYTKGEMNVFHNDVNTAIEAIFNHEPFKSRRNSFNIVAVEAVSKESGTSKPSKGIWKNTALHSHFDTFYSDRYLTTLNIKELHDCLAGIPYEHIIILTNTNEYGGGGILNSYVLSMTHHKQFQPVVVHEFGHSFGGLADEYAYEQEQIPMYPHDIEPWEPNITTLKNFHGKWENMIKTGTPIPTPESRDVNIIQNRIGLFEGAGYSLKGVYRGMQDCRMRTNENPEFCIICRKALNDLIDFYTK